MEFVFLAFAFFFLVGYAAFAWLAPRHVFTNILFAPTLGMSITLLGVFTLSRLHFPVLTFVWYWLLFLLISSGLLLYIKKPPFPWRRYRLFGIIWLGAAISIGFPFFYVSFGLAQYFK